MDRAELFRTIQIYDFVIHDTALYLDTHPTDQIALEYFDEIRDMYKKAVEAVYRKLRSYHNRRRKCKK